MDRGKGREGGREGREGGRGREIKDEFTQCVPENAEIQHKRVAVIEVETKKSACFKRIKESVHCGWLIKFNDDKTFLFVLFEIPAKLFFGFIIVCDCNYMSI